MPIAPLSPHEAQIAEKLAFFRNHPIFGILGQDLITQLRAHARVRNVERGTTVFAKGDPGSSLFAILEGQVKVISFSEHGKYAVFNILTAGDIFGEIALLDGGERTADVIAITDCKLLVIERRDFMPLLNTRPEVAQKLIEMLCKRLRNTSRQVEEVMFLDLSAKLARTLLRLGNGGREPRIALTQSEVAQLIGASRESTNKQLRDWENLKWIRLERGEIVLIDTASLETAAAGQT
ncbi:Crp/Fnr family transcriptional regulator [Pseudorhodoplanes sp.]|uniref:Crp/Fnr family transcriptional regulator n=1 Tax=Pseudorhodoplanes sp. TaxID=1934341 RepID=UPI002BACC293|nr:Crp/Fnr family transcriptional regulator [Pseudorhodoplanes sp.]HWV43277.1 Crp/Fnr family transcriptional regulator [Pseudorhodoplanes sp.]